MKNQKIKSLMFIAASILCIGGSAMAGPMPKYMMIHGEMMELTPMSQEVTLHNGAKIRMDGTVVSPMGHMTKLHDGDMVMANGKMMSPAANHAHGG